MKSFVRFCLVSIVLVAFAFFCDGLRANFLLEPDTQTAEPLSTGSLTTPAQSEHAFIKFNTPCLTSPTGEGQTVIRTVTGASASPFRHERRTDLDFKVLTFRSLYGFAVQRHSLPTLRKLRL